MQKNQKEKKKSLNDVFSTFPAAVVDTTKRFPSNYPQTPSETPSQTFTFNCKKEYTRVIARTHAHTHTHARTLMFPLSFSVTYTYIHNVVLSAGYTWPLISPWCPISLDLWWPSFRSFNIKALKCPPSQPHTHTHTCSYSAHAITLLLFYTACWVSPHTVPFTHISLPHLNASPS